MLLAGLLIPSLPGAAAERRSRCTDGTVPKWWSNYRAEGKERGKLTGAGSERRKSQEKAEKAAEASARRVLSGWLERRFYAVASWYATEHERSNEEITSQRIQALVDELVAGYLEESRRSQVQSFERCDGQFEAYALVELYAEGVSSEVTKQVIVELSGARAYRKAAVVREVEQKLERELMMSQEEKRAARARRTPRQDTKPPLERPERPSEEQNPAGSSLPSRGSACANAGYFHGTVWKSENLGTGRTVYVLLNSDGSSGRSKTPGDFVVDAGDTWRVEAGVLVLSWSDGYATERYSTDSSSCNDLRGQKTSRSWQGRKSTRLTRVAEQGGGLASAPARSPEGSPGMVSVPAGEFWYGCNESVDTECDDDEKPGKRITLPVFQIDRTEVTVSAYQRCVESGGCSANGLTMPYYLGAEQPKWAWACNWGKSGREDHPINCVSWRQAKTYCAWAGKRLPTEKEWEKAARGTDRRIYPWGNTDFSAAGRVANIADATAKREQPGWTAAEGYDDGYYGTSPVGSYPAGVSPYGALDMVGNVLEWTSTWYSSKQKGRVVRGGSWFDKPRYARTSYRRRPGPAERYFDIGLRCAQ